MENSNKQLPPPSRRARSLRVSLAPQERRQFERYAQQLLNHPQVLQMERFIRHDSVSCLEYNIAITELSSWVCRRLGLRADLNSLMRDALLYDFFLYDRHEKTPDRPGLHGFTHPRAALKNARRLFPLSERERDIIEKYMRPLTLGSYPRSRESVVIYATDRCCSLQKTFFCRSTKQP